MLVDGQVQDIMIVLKHLNSSVTGYGMAYFDLAILAHDLIHLIPQVLSFKYSRITAIIQYERFLKVLEIF